MGRDAVACRIGARRLTLTAGPSSATVWLTGCQGRWRRWGPPDGSRPGGQADGRRRVAYRLPSTSEASVGSGQAPRRSPVLARLGHIHLSTCAVQLFWGVWHHHLSTKLVPVARMGLHDPSRNRQLRCAHGWRIPERVQTVKWFLPDFSSSCVPVEDIRSTPKPVASF